MAARGTTIKDAPGDSAARAGTDSPPEPARHSNELSAPYEVPQFPIEMIESKLQQAKKEDEARKSGDEGLDMDIPDEVIIPHYQRVTANGERDDSSGVPIEDLKALSEMLVKAMEIREKYMAASHQKFPSYVKRFLGSKNGRVETLSPGDSVAKQHSIHPEPRKDPWEIEFQPDNGYKFQIVKGVYQVYRSQEDLLSRAKKADQL